MSMVTAHFAMLVSMQYNTCLFLRRKQILTSESQCFTFEQTKNTYLSGQFTLKTCFTGVTHLRQLYQDIRYMIHACSLEDNLTTTFLANISYLTPSS